MTPSELSGAWNFRDVAELTGIRPGLFFRSSELSGLDESGRKGLGALGITDVADLRSPREVERRGGDAVPDGVSVHLLPFPDLATTTAEAPHETSWRQMMTEYPGDGDAAGDAREDRSPGGPAGVRDAGVGGGVDAVELGAEAAEQNAVAIRGESQALACYQWQQGP